MSPGHTGDTVEVKVVLGRRLTSTIMTIYMPTILLNIIGPSTNYYKPQYFDARAVVNLMVMLMITTMFIGVNQSLPNTSDIKMVDFWLVFNLFIPFIEVLLQVYTETLNLDEVEKDPMVPHFKNRVETIPLPDSPDNSKSLTEIVGTANPSQGANHQLSQVQGKKAMTDIQKYKCSQILVKKIIPVLVLLFMCIYWIIGLSLYYNPNI